jgi:hypothetical protein
VFEISRAWDHWPGDGSKRPGSGKKPGPFGQELVGDGLFGLAAGASPGPGASPSLWDLWRATDEKGRPMQALHHAPTTLAASLGVSDAGRGVVVGVVPSLIGLGASPNPAEVMTPLGAQCREPRPDPVFAQRNLKSFEHNIPVRDLWNLVGMAASQRHAYFRRQDKVEYSPEGRDTLLAVAYWLWPYETSAPGDVMERFYHPEEFHRDILQALPNMRVPRPGEYQGAGAEAMAGHAQEMRILGERMACGQEPDVAASKTEGQREVRRTLQGALSTAANELTFHLPDMAGITDSKQYRDDPNIQRVTRPVTGAGRDLILTAIGLRPVATGAPIVTRFIIGGARTYSGVNTVRGAADSSYNVLTGKATWLDALNLATNALGAKDAARTLKQQGASGLWFHFTAEPRVGPDIPNPGAVPGATHLDNTVMTGITAGKASATELATKHAGAMVIIKKVKEEASKEGFRQAYEANRAIYRYRIAVIRNPTKADVTALEKTMSQRFAGEANDQMILAAAKKHQGFLITGDHEVLRDALSAKHYDVVFALHHMEAGDVTQLQRFVKAMQEGERITNLVRNGNPAGIYKPTGKKGIPADPDVPHNWVILDWTPIGN